MSQKRNIRDVIRDENDTNQILYEYFTSDVRPGYVLVEAKENGNSNCVEYCMPQRYRDFETIIDEYEVRDSDIYVTSFPKTGTTWVQEMVWCIANDLDLKRATSELIQERFPFLEVSILFNIKPNAAPKDDPSLPDVEFLTNSFEFTAKQTGKNRFVKTHLPWQMLPRSIQNGTKKPKIIYVYRNPLDTCVSLYHHSRALEGYRGNFEQFLQLFINDRLSYAPYFPHVNSFYQQNDRENVLLITFEDMKKDLRKIIHQVADFLGKTLTEDQVKTLEEHLSFAQMSKNKMVNYELFMDPKEKFLRSGQVGGYKVAMTPEMAASIENWMNEQSRNFPFDFNHLKI